MELVSFRTISWTYVRLGSRMVYAMRDTRCNRIRWMDYKSATAW